MKKVALALVCASFAVVVSSCGGTGDPRPADQAAKPGESSATLTSTVVKKNKDGTVERRTYQETPEQRKASLERRREEQRLRKVGAQSLTIDGWDCEDGRSLWLFTDPYLSGNRCCLFGEGGDYLSFLCNSNMESLWAGWSGGYYNYIPTYCYDTFTDGISYDTLTCGQIDFIGLDF